MTDLRSSNIYETLDEDAPVVSTKKDTKPAASEKLSSKKVDAPAKKEKPTKSEDPAAPVGKDQRGGGGRESKPRGRGRDNKGGLRKPQGDRPVREFDRRSGPSATHRNPKEGKRHDRGSHNWGDPVEEGTIAAQPTEEVTPTSPPPAVEENKTTEAATENKEEQKENKKEEIDNTVTYDQYLKIKDSKAPENDKLEARAVEIEEGRWKVATTLVSEKKSKKKSDDSEEDKEDDKTEKSSKKKKNIVTWDQFVASAPKSAPREARPPRETSERGAGVGAVAGVGARGRGTRGGRGGARGGGRGRGRDGVPPNLSEEVFPKLGK